MKIIYLLLFLLFVLVQSISAQNDTQLKAFTNYGSCYQGLKTENGKIIWPADFESLRKVWNYEYEVYPRKFNWIAERNGSFGFIDTEGKRVLPFVYSKMEVVFEGIIATDDSAAYLFSHKGELKLKLDGYSWLRPTPGGYYVLKGDKYGFLDLNSQVILAPEYDVVYFSQIVQPDEGIQEVLSDRFLTVEQDNQKAIFDIKKKQWVVPFTTDFIYPYWATNCAGSDALFHLYSHDNNTAGIVNSNGIQVLPFVEPNPPTTIEMTPLDSCGTQSHQLVYLEKHEKMQAVNGKTGKFSKKYSELFPLQGYSVFFEKKYWGVLDPELNELGQHKYPKVRFSDFELQENAPQQYKAKDRFGLYFNGQYQYPRIPVDSVLITRDQHLNKDEQYPSERFGIVNFRTGKRIKAKYEHIAYKDYQEQAIYWAFETYDYERELGTIIEQLDIFNTDLKLIKQFKGKLIIEATYRRNHKDHLIILTDGKSGVINPLGEEIIPIIYNKCHRLEVLSTENITKTITLFVANNGEKHLLFDYNGNVILDADYLGYTPREDLVLALRKDHLYDLYDANGKLILSEVRTEYGAHPRINEYGKCIGIEDKERFTVRNCTYFTKGDHVYEFREGNMYLLDESFFKFTENYCYFLEWIIIDSKGKIVTTNPQGVSRRNSDWQYKRDHPSECSYFLDEYPVPKKENKRTTSNYTPPLKKYVWKLHDANKPNEWFLYNQQGELTYSEPFEYPLKERIFSGGVFKQNGKFGYFDSKYNQVLPAEYDFIFPRPLLSLKDGMWQIHDIENGKVSQHFDGISLDYFNHLRFVFKDGKIGLLNDAFELEVPLTDSAEFVNKYDLTKLLKFSGHYNYKKTHIVSDLIFNGSPTSVYRSINNYHIVERAYLHSTFNHVMKFTPIDQYRNDLPHGIRNMVLYHNPIQKVVQRRPKYCNQYYYSEMTLTRNNSWSTDVWARSNDDRYKQKQWFNYKIEGNRLVKINLDDVLKSDAVSQAKLNEMMIKELTRIQAFGENCTDIESKLEQLKQNFLLDGSKITFFWDEYAGFQLQFRLSELKEIIRYPNRLTAT